jgi:hypothetical protein
MRIFQQLLQAGWLILQWFLQPALLHARYLHLAVGSVTVSATFNQQITALTTTDVMLPYIAGLPCSNSATSTEITQPRNSSRQHTDDSSRYAAAGVQQLSSHTISGGQAALLAEEPEVTSGRHVSKQQASALWQESRVCSKQQFSPLEAISRVLLPGQQVLVTLLEKHEGSYRKSEKPQQLQFTVVGLLGKGGTSEAHEVQQLLPASSAATPTDATGICGENDNPTAAAAGSNTSGSGIGPPHMALKVPLRLNTVPPNNQKGFSGETHFYMWSCAQLAKECNLLTQLAGKPGITRCHGLGLVSFRTQSQLDVTARGMPLEVGDLQQQLAPEPGVFVAVSPREAWLVIKDMVRALCCVHRITKHVYVDAMA